MTRFYQGVLCMSNVKSIIEIEIKNEQYQKHIDSFIEYDGMLKGTAHKWEFIGKQAASAASPIGKISDHTKTISSLLDSMTAQIGKFNKAGSQTEKSTKETKKHFLDILGASKETTALMIKWGSIGSAGLGVAAAGFYAMSKIAGSESNLRKETKTLGISAGELESQKANFEKYVDVDSYLHNISQTRGDISKKGALITAGMGGMDKLDNADFAAKALLKARETFIKYGSTQQGADASGLTQIGFTFDTLKNLENHSKAEIEASIAKEKSDRSLVAQSDKQLKSWQDLNIQIDIFTRSLKAVTADVLLPLAKLINNPSGETKSAFSRMIEHPVDFWTGNGKAFKGSSSSNNPSNEVGSTNTKESDLSQTQQGSRPSSNNPGNLRIPGQSTGFAHPKTLDDGFFSLARQLKLYASGNSKAAHHQKLDTIASILSVYAPSSENNTGAYIKDVSNRTGFNPNQHLDLNDRAVLAKLMSAITKHENNKTNYTPQQIQASLQETENKRQTTQPVTVYVNNNTGGNAVVTMSQVAH
jgi:hypothetical protein